MYKHKSFKPRDGQTITVDHHVSTFTVTIRHMNAVTTETIKRILQSRLEVIHVEDVDSRVICTNPRY